MNDILLGSHISLAAPDYYAAAVKEAHSWGENVFMFYTGAPQNTKRIPLDKMRIEEGRALIKDYGMDEKNIVVHAPYIINLANTKNEATKEIARSFLVEELRRTAAFGLRYLILHPGSAVDAPREEAIAMVAEGLNEVLKEDGTDVIICLETMAGKGNELGRTFEELKAIRDLVERKERIGVCLDTCHIHDAGYDIKDIDGVLSEFDSVLGLDLLKVIHLNDSKNERGTHKDRHANIGYGAIGFDALLAYVNHPRLAGIPKILETPYIDHEFPPYEEEIAQLRNGKFVGLSKIK